MPSRSECRLGAHSSLEDADRQTGSDDHGGVRTTPRGGQGLLAAPWVEGRMAGTLVNPSLRLYLAESWGMGGSDAGKEQGQEESPGGRGPAPARSPGRVLKEGRHRTARREGYINAAVECSAPLQVVCVLIKTVCLPLLTPLPFSN